MHNAESPRTGEVGRAAQPQHGLHGLASVPIHLFYMVRSYSELVATAQAPRLQDIPAATCAHTLTKAVHTLAPANLRLPGAFG